MLASYPVDEGVATNLCGPASLYSCIATEWGAFPTDQMTAILDVNEAVHGDRNPRDLTACWQLVAGLNVLAQAHGWKVGSLGYCQSAQDVLNHISAGDEVIAEVNMEVIQSSQHYLHFMRCLGYDNFGNVVVDDPEGNYDGLGPCYGIRPDLLVAAINARSVNGNNDYAGIYFTKEKIMISLPSSISLELTQFVKNLSLDPGEEVLSYEDHRSNPQEWEVSNTNFPVLEVLILKIHGVIFNSVSNGIVNEWNGQEVLACHAKIAEVISVDAATIASLNEQLVSANNHIQQLTDALSAAQQKDTADLATAAQAQQAEQVAQQQEEKAEEAAPGQVGVVAADPATSDAATIALAQAIYRIAHEQTIAPDAVQAVHDSVLAISKEA